MYTWRINWAQIVCKLIQFMIHKRKKWNVFLFIGVENWIWNTNEMDDDNWLQSTSEIRFKFVAEHVKYER